MISNIKRGFHHKLNEVHDNYRENPHKQSKHRAIFYGIPIGILLIIATVVTLFMVTYGDKASPATYLSGVDVSGKTRSEIKYVANNILEKIEITLTNGDMTVKANAKDLGMSLRDDDTAAAAVNANVEHNIFVQLNPFWRKNAALQMNYDYVILQGFLNEKFASITTPTIDPTIVYDGASAQFSVVPGISGEMINVDDLSQKINDILVQSAIGTIGVQAVAAEPKVSIATAERARDYMNLRVNLALNLNYNGQLLYFIDPPDIAAWADIAPNPTTGEIDIEFDKAKIKMFLTDKVAPSIASAPVDKKVLVDKEGKELMVVQQGRAGRQPRDFEVLVDQVYSAVTSGTNLEQELDLAEANFKTIELVTEDTNWIEVNLSNQTTMLWNGTQLLRTFVVSSGVANHPTVTGEFRVWYKTSSQTMTGGSRADGSYYNLANVQWVSYFYQDYAFHGKWWNSIYGAPSSHGCINMTNADAKVVYDFAPIGTRVVVHY